MFGLVNREIHKENSYTPDCLENIIEIVVDYSKKKKKTLVITKSKWAGQMYMYFFFQKFWKIDEDRFIWR